MQPLQHPPHLPSLPGLDVGDVYLHVVYPHDPAHFVAENTDDRLWLRALDDNGDAIWRSVRLGYTRDDGRKLFVKATGKMPTWVSGSFYKAVQKRAVRTV